MKRLLLALSLLAMTASTVLAHDPRPGPNGGMKVDAGNRYHAELVARGTPDVVLFLYDAGDKPIASTGFRGNAILVVDGKTQRFELQPADGSRLVGTAPVAVPAGAKGAVQLTAPDGTTAQAKF
ncbi:MAG: hypothetical protein PSV46_02315 [Reyranella sp.]|nr:hypothetical protein [Reyranella sp.]